MPVPPADLSQRHLARIVDSSDDAIISKNLESTILSWNASAERMFGYSPEEAIGKSIRMIIPADRQHEEDFVLGEISEGRSVRHYETIRQHKDGSLVPISLTVSPIYDDNGRVVGASKIARDISERVQLLAEAREQARIAQQLSRVGTDLASSLDQETIERRVTELGRELTHAEHCIFDSRFDGAGPMRLDDVTREPRHRHNPLTHRMPQDHHTVRSYLAVPVRGAGGSVLGGLYFGHSMPGVFSAYHEQLAVGLAAWTSVALENARLFVEAREADRLKDEFLAVFSHELRTPLNAIVGYARLLHGGVMDESRSKRAIETIERNAAILTQIVEDVLDVSRIVSGKIRLDVQPVDVAAVVQNAIATVRPALDAKGVRLETIIDPRVGPVSGDPSRLQQVVWNLLSNAAKFTPKEGRVQVRVERVSSHIDIVVSDTGIGIRPEFLPFVFERFRQADSATTRKTGGLGIGLSIVRQLVELHGGTVQVASEGEGLGSTFRISLPTMIVHAEVHERDRTHPRTPRPGPLHRTADLEGVSIVAVDDDADALGLLRLVFESAGAHVQTFSSGVEALEKLAAIHPDVMVVDLGMPEMDGYEFIRRVRASTDRDVAAIPAAALTAFARPEDRIKALRTGFEMHLSKPADPGELVASVVTLRRRAAARSADAR